MKLTFMIHKPVRTQMSDEDLLEMIAEDEIANLEIKKQEQLIASYGLSPLNAGGYVDYSSIPFGDREYWKNFEDLIN